MSECVCSRRVNQGDGDTLGRKTRSTDLNESLAVCVGGAGSNADTWRQMAARGYQWVWTERRRERDGEIETDAGEGNISPLTAALFCYGNQIQVS